MAHFRKSEKNGEVLEKTKLPVIVSPEDNSSIF